VSTKVTVKGQVTLPKAVRDAAGIKPGDRVSVRARPEGGLVVEKVRETAAADEYRRRLEDIARRRPIRDLTTDELMQLLRGDD